MLVGAMQDQPRVTQVSEVSNLRGCWERLCASTLISATSVVAALQASILSNRAMGAVMQAEILDAAARSISWRAISFHGTAPCTMQMTTQVYLVALVACSSLT